jgi:MoaA/NifB/PqqE/SkfB family radical SAM enzyme
MAILSASELAHLVEKLQFENLHLPLKLDWEVLGGCDRRCSGCWGPRHNVRRTVSKDQLIQFFSIARRLGTYDVVITGGEPLFDRELDDIIEFLATELDFEITLSTSGVGLLNRPRILANLAKLGLPIDAPSPEQNAIMRPPAGHVDPHSNFWSVNELLRNVPQLYPQIELTLRTVVTSTNIDWVLEIPGALETLGVKLGPGCGIRWKIYQLNTKVDTHLTHAQQRDQRVSTWQFQRLLRQAQQQHARKFHKIEGQKAADSGNRYAILSPQGILRILRPQRFGKISSHLVGSILTPEALVRKFNQDHPDFILEQAQVRPTHSAWRFDY